MTKPNKKQLALPCVAETDYDADDRLVAHGVEYLRMARDIFQGLKCPKTLAKVNLALSSALGAERNVRSRRYRAQRFQWRDVPPCATSMRCLCAGHARGNPASAPCDTSEQATLPGVK